MRLYRTNGALRLDLQGEAIRLRQGDSGLALRLKLDAAEEGTSWRAKISNGHCVNDTVELTSKDDGVTMLLPLAEQYLYEAGTLYVSVAAVKNEVEQWSNSVGITVTGKTNCCAGRRPVTPPEVLRGTLTFTGAVSAEYDGSMDVVVNIPSGGSGDTAGAERTVWYGECSTAAETDEKTVTVGDGFTLTEGVTVCIRFAKPNTSVTPMLNVNGTGAKSLVNSANLAPVNEWGYGYYVHMIYNGTSWCMTTPTDAGKTNKGIVNLSNDYSATGDVVAASTAAVRNALAAAKEYADKKSSDAKPLLVTVVDGQADYGVSDIKAAYNAGCDVKMLNMEDTLYAYLNHVDSSRAVFVYVDAEIVRVYTMDTQGTVTAVSQALDGKKTGGERMVWYGTCDTAGLTVKKTVSVDDGFTLAAGRVILVKFAYLNGTNAPTLNVGATGAKNIKRLDGTTDVAQLWSQGQVVPFVYDGESWIVVSGGKANTDLYGATRLSSATDSSSEELAATPKAVSDALSAAKAYADKLIGDVENGTY